MRKKRNIIFSVGGFVLLLLSFVTVVTLATNTPDARLERALTAMIDDFGLEMSFEYESDDYDFGGDTVEVTKIYSTTVFNETDEDKLVARLTKECEGCTVEYVDRFSGLDEDINAWFYETDETYNTISSLIISMERQDIAGNEIEPVLHLAVERIDHAGGLLNKVRSWLPW